MKKTLILIMFLTPGVSFGVSRNVSEQCTTARVLTQIRPGAAWSLHGDSMDRLTWLDGKQKKPSKREVRKAKKQCIENVESREKSKKQARLDVKNKNLSVEKRLEQLILLLGYDK